MSINGFGVFCNGILTAAQKRGLLEAIPVTLAEDRQTQEMWESKFSLKNMRCDGSPVVPKINKSRDRFSIIRTQLVYSSGSFASKEHNLLMNVKFVLFFLSMSNTGLIRWTE